MRDEFKGDDSQEEGDVTVRGEESSAEDCPSRAKSVKSAVCERRVRSRALKINK
jgi:hypothetical protein